MSLKEARRIATRATRQGRKVVIRENREACDLRDPKRHRMSGHCVVVETYSEGPYGATRYLWE